MARIVDSRSVLAVRNLTSRWGLREFTLRTPDGHRITFGQLLRGSSVEGS